MSKRHDIRILVPMTSPKPAKSRIQEACIDLENALNEFHKPTNASRIVSEDERLKELRQTLTRIKKQIGTLSV